MLQCTFFIDNCGKYVKCAYNFGFIGDCEVYAANDPTRWLHVDAPYFGACHGKSLSDSEGGVVKTFAKNQVVSELLRILSLFDLFLNLKPELDFDLRLADKTQVRKFNPFFGTGQLLMAMTTVGN